MARIERDIPYVEPPGKAWRYRRVVPPDGSPQARLSEARDALEGAMHHFGDVDASIYSSRERV